MMQIQVGLELNVEGRVQAWALDLPGCFGYGSDGPEAVVALAREAALYEEWANRHGGPGMLELGDYDLRIVDTWEVYSMTDRYEVSEDGYSVNAWFRQDWKPLSAAEVERGLALLRWSREDMLAVALPLHAEEIDRKYPQERWSIRGILKHIGAAEWWYLSRLGLSDGKRDSLPQDAFERLAFVRQRMNEALPTLVGVEEVLGVDGEFWSPRKMLRRAVWHEMDHRLHILKLLDSHA
jgi:hypothetical protein